MRNRGCNVNEDQKVTVGYFLTHPSSSSSQGGKISPANAVILFKSLQLPIIKRQGGGSNSSSKCEIWSKMPQSRLVLNYRKSRFSHQSLVVTLGATSELRRTGNARVARSATKRMRKKEEFAHRSFAEFHFEVLFWALPTRNDSLVVLVATKTKRPMIKSAGVRGCSLSGASSRSTRFVSFE